MWCSCAARRCSRRGRSHQQKRSCKCDVWSTKLSVSGDTISSLVSHGAVTACWDGEERLLPHGRRHAPEHLAQASLPQLFLRLLRLFGPVFLVGVSLRCCCAVLLSVGAPPMAPPCASVPARAARCSTHEWHDRAARRCAAPAGHVVYLLRAPARRRRRASRVGSSLHRASR